MRTFVVRLIERRLGEGSLRGVAEDIATGRGIHFASAAELTEFLAESPAEVDADHRDASGPTARRAGSEHPRSPA